MERERPGLVWEVYPQAKEKRLTGKGERVKDRRVVHRGELVERRD